MTHDSQEDQPVEHQTISSVTEMNTISTTTEKNSIVELTPEPRFHSLGADVSNFGDLGKPLPKETSRFHSLGADVSNFSDLGKPLPKETPKLKELQTNKSMQSVSPLRCYGRVLKRSSEVAAHLPPTPHKRAMTLSKLLLRTNRETNGLVMRYLLADKKGRDLLHKTMGVQEAETKEMLRTVRQIAVYRSKKQYQRVEKMAQVLTSKYKGIRYIARQTKMTYSSLHWTLNKKKSKKNCKGRNITAEQRTEVLKHWMNQQTTMKLPYKRYAKYRYMRVAMETAWREYCRKQKYRGGRVLCPSAARKCLPKCLRLLKQVPYKQCLCINCLNFSKRQDAIRAAKLRGVDHHMTTSIFASMCPPVRRRQMEKIAPVEKRKKGKELKKDEPFAIRRPVKKEARPVKKECRPVKKEAMPVQNEVSQPGVSHAASHAVNKAGGGLLSPVKMHHPGSSEERRHDVSKEEAGETTFEAAEWTDPITIFDFQRKCIFRKCTECGEEKARGELQKQNPNADWTQKVRWFQWETTHQTNPDGTKKRLDLQDVEHTGTLLELVNSFHLQTMKMSMHFFHYKWQAFQFEYIRQNLDRGTIVEVMDFGQNVTHRSQNEPQSAHWHRNTSTIHPVVAYYRCPQASCNEVVTDEIMIISADKKHDAQAVETFTIEAELVLEEQGIPMKRFIQFTDNCAGQYKCSTSFVLLSRRNKPTQRNYFGASHGKGPGDSCIGRVVQAVDKAVRSNKAPITDGIEFYFFCINHLQTKMDLQESRCVHFRQHFRYVHRIEREKLLSGAPLPRTQTLHSVRNTGTYGIVQCRETSCFCRLNDL